MSAQLAPQTPAHPHRINDHSLIDKVVDVLYIKLLDDHRVNRFFYTRPLPEQSQALKTFLYAAVGNHRVDELELGGLLDDYLMTAFARNNTVRNAVTGQDFAFLLDIVGGPEAPPITLMCPAHSHLIKLTPDDYQYDVVMELLAASLKDLGITGSQAEQIMAIGEMGRDGALGRGKEMMPIYD